MNFEQLITRFAAQGFEYLSTAELGEYINDSYLLDICEDEDWPFLEETATGVAPLVIENLRAVEYVVNSTQKNSLVPIDRRHLIADVDTDLTTAGTPTYWYLTAGNTVNVYPANTSDKLSVRYWKVPAELSGTATPLLPSRFHSLLVDGAVARAYENSDDYELREAKIATFQDRLERMRESLDVQNRDGPTQYIEITDPEALT